MTRDEIIRMADKAGFEICSGDGWPNEWLLSNIEKFANLVAAAEREACAKVCDGWPDYDVQGLAEAIRARGKHE